MPTDVQRPPSEKELARQIYHLRTGGVPFVEIADQMQTSTAVVIEYYRGYVVEAAKSLTTDERRLAIATELNRLDSLQSAYWNDALSGEVKSAEFVLKVMTHRAKLMGLDQLGSGEQTEGARVLIVGGDQASFLAALQAGRAQHALTGEAIEDGDDR